jgi:hypothetical protein
MPCDAVAAALPGLIDGTGRLDRTGRRHIEGCLRCQADLARYHKLRRTMRSLAAQELAPPAGLLESLLAAIEDADGVSRRRALAGRRATYVGGIAATAAAGAGAAIVLVSRGRRGRLPLAG